MSAAFWPLFVALLLGVILLGLNAFGCRLDTTPLTAPKHSVVIAVPQDPSRPFGRQAPRYSDEDAGT